MNRRQTVPAELRYTFQQFDCGFPTDYVCLEAIKEQRFPEGQKSLSEVPKVTLTQALDLCL